MSTIANAFTANELRSAIVCNPLVVSAETPVMEAIAQMSGLRVICASDRSREIDNVHQEARSSCILVIGADKIIGIITERDVVRLCAKERSLNNLTVSEVMTSPVATLREADFTDLFSAVNLLQQRRIRHMPIVDHDDRLLGIITHESLRQLARPVDLLRLRLVSEVMTTNVICAEPSTSMLAIAQLMSAHHVGSVLIVENQIDLEGNPLQIPLGIVTERDIVQFQALGLQLEQIEVQAVMSAPVFAVRPDDTLMVVQQVMEQRSIRRLVVTGHRGELLGVVTQTSLLQALNPLELYTLSKLLEQKVAELEAEKLRLLEGYNHELERQVAQRTSDLHKRVEREQLIARIAAKIAASLYLPEILETTVQELRAFLSCDRLTIYRFHPDWTGAIISESVGAGWRAALHDEIVDPCFRGDVVQQYNEGHKSAIANIHNAGYPDCYVQLLEEYQVKANLVVPIRVSGQLWGLLIAHQCDDYREWQESDLTLLDEIAVQLAIAIQQAEAYHQVQIELIERQRVELSLRNSEQRFRAIFNNSFQFIGLLALDGTLLEANQTALTIGGISHEDVVGRPFWEAYWWQISTETQGQLQQAIARASKGEFVCYEVDVWGENQTIIPIEFSLRPIFDESGRIVLLIPEGRDLRELKLSQEELQQSEQRFFSLATAAPVGIYRTDDLGQCLYVNECWCQIAGITPEEAMGFGWINGIHPSDRELVSQEWNASIEANRPFKLEYRFQNAEGQITWAFGQAVAERDESGEIIGYIGTITDISDRKKAEEDLKVQRDFNQLIAEISSRFVDVSPDQLDFEIDRSLQLIGQATNTDSSYLIKFSFRENISDGTVTMTNEWTQPEYPRQVPLVQDAPASAFAWANAKLMRREIINIPNVAEAPIEAANDQATWQSFNLVAILSVPIVQKSIVTGTMGFVSFSNAVTWDDETIRLLQVMAQTIANAQLRVQEEQKLFESEERLRLALRATNQGLYDFNVKTGESITSLEYATMLGYNPANFQETGAKWVERMHPDDREYITKVFQDYIAGILPEYKVEFRQLTQTGEWKWILSLGKIVSWDEEGHPLRMLGTHTDISDRKKIEAERLLTEQVRQELKILETVFDTVLAGYWDWDLQNDEEYLSPKLKKMFGYEDDELPNSPESWQHLIFDEDLAKVLDCFDRHVQSRGEIPYHNEVRYQHKDGSMVWVICSGQVIAWDEDDRPLRMVGCHIDISDRKQAEEQLRKSDTHLKTAQRIGKLGSWEFDPHTGLITWSDEVFRIFGRDLAAGVPSFEEIQEYWHPDDRDRHQQAVQTAIETVQSYEIECRFYLADGTLGYIVARGEPIVDISGQLVLLIGTILDISDRKLAETKLMQISSQLAASNKELEAFAYSVSHDLRSPLRAIDGFSQALLEDYGDKFDEDAKDYFDRIRRNVARMGNLIEDLLNLSRVSRSEMRYKNVNLSMLVQEQLEELQIINPERMVEVAIAPNICVSADLTLMRVVISNLIQNAWKFTSQHPTARIEFGMISSETQQERQLTYFVRDDGAGFDMNYAKMLFGVFQRLHNTNEFAGTGIGLATVQRAIHRHGGRVWAEGAIEQGATIYFTVPNAPSQEMTS